MLPEPTAPETGRMGANPFKGLDYFVERDAHPFAGRDREAQEVLNGILRSRTFLVYGRSGLGKTSLLRAGVFPPLSDRGAVPVYARVLEDPVADVRRALERALAPLAEQDAGAETDVPIKELILRLSASSPGGGRMVVVVLDQFEEFFVRFAENATLAQGLRSHEELTREQRLRRREQQQELIRLVGELAADNNLNLRLVFSLREDWIAEMRSFEGAVPDIMAAGYRLLPLTSFGARQAIVETLRAAGLGFETALISNLVESLSDVQFDPAVLQVVCSEVWQVAVRRQGSSGAMTLAASDLESAGSVVDIFQRYLGQLAEHLREATEAPFRVRTWAVLEALISEQRTKWAVRREALLSQSFEVSAEELEDILRLLHDRRLIRRDPSLTWVELIHERLVEVVLASLARDPDYFQFQSARNLVSTLCRGTDWRRKSSQLMNPGQLDGSVGPFKELLRFTDDERLFLLASAISGPSTDLEYWIERAGVELTSRQFSQFLEQTDSPALRATSALALGRFAAAPKTLVETSLRLALTDPAPEVRQAAARSFCLLASTEDYQPLQAAFRDRKTRRQAGEVLTAAAALGKLPQAKGMSLWQKLQARRRLRREQLETHRLAIRDSSLIGAVAGLKSGVIWAFSFGLLASYYWTFEGGNPDAYPTMIDWGKAFGIFLCLSLAGGTFFGWHLSRQTARLSATECVKYSVARVLRSGLIPRLCLIVFVVGLAYVTAQVLMAEDPFGSPNTWFSSSFAAGFGALSYLTLTGWVLHWLSRRSGLGSPSILSGVTGWLWSFAFAAAPVLILTTFADPLEILAGDLDVASPSLFFLSTLHKAAALGAIGFVIVGAVTCGLSVFSSLSALRALASPSLALPSGSDMRSTNHRSIAEGSDWLGFAIALAFTFPTVWLVGISFGWNSFPLRSANTVKIPPAGRTIPVSFGRADRDCNYLEVGLEKVPPEGTPWGSGPALVFAEALGSSRLLFREESTARRGNPPSPEPTFKSDERLRAALVLEAGETRRLAVCRTERPSPGAAAERIMFRVGQSGIPPAQFAGTSVPLVARLGWREGAWQGAIPLASVEHWRDKTLELSVFPGFWWQGDAPKSALLSALTKTTGSKRQAIVLSRGQVGHVSLSGAVPVPVRLQQDQLSLSIRPLGVETVAKTENAVGGFIVELPGAELLVATYKGDENTGLSDLTVWLVPSSVPPAQTSTVSAAQPPAMPKKLWSHAQLRRYGLDPEGSWFFTGLDTDKARELWTLKNGKAVRSLQVAGTAVACSFPVKKCLFAGDGRQIELWSTEPPNRLATVEAGDKILSIEGSTNLDRFVVLTQSAVELWNASSPPVRIRQIHLPDEHELGAAKFASISIDPEGRRALAIQGRVVWVWSFIDAPRATPLVHDCDVQVARFSPKGSSVLTACDRDGVARIWHSDEPGEPILELRHESPVTAGWFNWSGPESVTTISGNELRRWYLDDPTNVLVFPHEQSVLAAQRLLDTGRLLTLTNDGTLRSWDFSPDLLKDPSDLFVFLSLGPPSDQREIFFRRSPPGGGPGPP